MNDRNTMATRTRRATRHVRAAMAVALTAALPVAVSAQAPQPITSEAVVALVDSMVRAYMAEKQPASMSVAVSRGSETLYEGAFGMADIAANRPATTASIYKIGSVSKQFTAALILKQIERGNLALADSIGGYLTGLRPEWRPLTIEQLLNHTSGLQNDLQREGRPEEEVSTGTMIAWAARDTMASAPGTRFGYSNVGYLLLGALVENLYGKSYGAALQEEIADPLGLRTLGWCTEPNGPTGTMGSQYDGPGKFRPQGYAHPSKSLGAGGLCSTAADMAAWNRALHGGRVLSPSSYAVMTTPRGAAPRYGFGLQMTTTPWGVPALYHLGATAGFAAENAWFPADSLSVTILYNSYGPANGFPSNFILELARAVSEHAPPRSGAAAAGPGAAAVAAQPRTPPPGTLDSIASANLARDRTIGAVVGIVKGTDTLHRGAYGKANIESGAPMQTDAIFAIGSITKQFTAAAILQLRDQGKLALDDDITKWVPDFDTQGASLPLRLLLSHTSGIPNVVSTMSEIARLRFDPNTSPDSIYALINRRHPLQFDPGTAQVYSNTAYWLLHRVIENASGMTYQQYLDRMIFEPLGMSSSGICHGAANLPRRATGYGVQNGQSRLAPESAPAYLLGSGVLCSSVDDMLRWLQALHGGRVLSQESYQEMVEPATLADGTPLRYGMGVDVRQDARGKDFIGHSGELPGYAARANWYPDARMAIVVLMNNSFDSSPTALVDELAAQFLPADLPAPKPFTGDGGELVGTYQGTRSTGPTTIEVARGTEGLTISINGAAAQPLAWVEGLTFRHGGVLLSFRRANGGTGQVTELRYDTGTEHSILTRSQGRL